MVIRGLGWLSPGARARPYGISLKGGEPNLGREQRRRVHYCFHGTGGGRRRCALRAVMGHEPPITVERMAFAVIVLTIMLNAAVIGCL